jgi:putative transposase
LARSIADMSFFELSRQLEYKANVRDGEVVEAARFSPAARLAHAAEGEAGGIAAVRPRLDVSSLRDTL